MALGSLAVEEVTVNSANQLIASWRASGDFAQSTLHKRVVALRSILRHLMLCGAHPRIMIGLTKVKKPGARLIRSSPEEIQRLLAAAPPWMRCFIIIAAHHGLRLGEALRLSAANFDEATKTISYRTKNEQTNTLPRATSCRNIFRTAPPSDDRHRALVWRIKGSELTSRMGFYRQWRNLLKRAGANPDLNPHDLRRTVALNAYAATKDLKVCQAILGHKSLGSTAIYLEAYGNPELREVMRALATGTPAEAGVGPRFNN